MTQLVRLDSSLSNLVNEILCWHGHSLARTYNIVLGRHTFHFIYFIFLPQDKSE